MKDFEEPPRSQNQNRNTQKHRSKNVLNLEQRKKNTPLKPEGCGEKLQFDISYLRQGMSLTGASRANQNLMPDNGLVIFEITLCEI